MRVHHIINDFSRFTGGAQRVVRSLHTGLRSRNIESYILGLSQQKDDHLDGTYSLGLKSPYALRAVLGIQQYVRNQVQPEDIIHVHLFPPLFYLSLLKILGQVPCQLVCTEHSTSNHRRGTILGHLLDSLTYAGYNQVIAISEGVEEELLKWKPRLKGKTSVIHNGGNLYYMRAIRRDPKKSIRVLSVGNLYHKKNLDTALEAVALLEDLDFEYCIAGKGECEKSLIRLCHRLGIESKVRFLGYVENVAALLAKADIFLMPSRWEGFGLAAVEAMNASLPLVVSNVAGLREVVNSNATCALLIEPEDPVSIAAALRQLLISHDLRIALGENAFQQAQNFSVERMVKNHLDLYGQLA
jgi:glycosyltransferase involved in cell wall biosynthesis